MASPIAADGSVRVSDRSDLAYNRNPPRGSLRAIAGQAWLAAVLIEEERRVAVTAAMVGPFTVNLTVHVRRLFLWPSERRQMIEAIQRQIEMVLPAAGQAHVLVEASWRGPP